jgi:hypothetical protein
MDAVQGSFNCSDLEKPMGERRKMQFTVMLRSDSDIVFSP